MTVWDALGINNTLQGLVDAISQGKLTRVLVQGRSGTGKTVLCNVIAEKLAVFDFQSVSLRGDIARSAQEYYPFFNLLRSRSTLAETREVFTAAVDDLPAGKNLVKRAIDMVGSYSD